MRFLVGCVVAALLLTGCTSDPQPVAPAKNPNQPGSPGGGAPPPGGVPGNGTTPGRLSGANGTVAVPPPQVVTVDLNLDVGLGTADMRVAEFGSTMQSAFDTDVNFTATGLLLEATWTCGTPSCKLHFTFDPPGDNETIEIDADGGFSEPHSAPLEFIASGTWNLLGTSRDVILQLKGTLKITIFYDGPVPAGYTSLGA